MSQTCPSVALGKLALPFTGHYSKRVDPIWDLLKLIKGLVLWKDTHNISMTCESHRISQGSSGENSVIMVYQNPEALNQTNDSLQ